MLDKPARDYITIREFSPLAQDGLTKACKHYQLADPSEISCIEGWAKLFFELKVVPDNEDYFPNGKWATIQHLERMLMEYSCGRIKPNHKESVEPQKTETERSGG